MTATTAATQHEEELFPGYPRGWFVIGVSKELSPGDVRPIKYFGRDMVLYRSESGTPIVHDAFCPHLGAHLGHGGTVVGETIQCPFHAWRFGADGRCVDVPYAKRIPPRASVTNRPTRERNGLIFLWNPHEEGETPTWEIPTIPEYGSDGWTDWGSELIHIKTHPKEIVENLADRGHFGPVHGTWASEFGNDFEGHIGKQFVKGVAYPRGGGEDHFELQSTYYGPGYMLSAMQSFLPNIQLLCHTPIDKRNVHVRIGAMIDVSKVKDRGEVFQEKYRQNIITGFQEDIRIWENKRYRVKPMLCDGDGDVGGLRRWYQKFYMPQSKVGY